MTSCRKHWSSVHEVRVCDIMKSAKGNVNKKHHPINAKILHVRLHIAQTVKISTFSRKHVKNNKFSNNGHFVRRRPQVFSLVLSEKLLLHLKGRISVLLELFKQMGTAL